MRYTFRLETLRRLRSIRRNELRTRLAEAYEALRIVDERAAQLQQEQELVVDARRSLLLGGRLDVNQLIAAQRYELSLSSQRQTLATQREQLAAETESRRLALVEADRDVKALDKLDEKQRSAFEAVGRRAEAKVLDEVAQRTKGTNDY